MALPLAVVLLGARNARTMAVQVIGIGAEGAHNQLLLKRLAALAAHTDAAATALVALVSLASIC